MNWAEDRLVALWSLFTFQNKEVMPAVATVQQQRRAKAHSNMAFGLDLLLTDVRKKVLTDFRDCGITHLAIIIFPIRSSILGGNESLAQFVEFHCTAWPAQFTVEALSILNFIVSLASNPKPFPGRKFYRAQWDLCWNKCMASHQCPFIFIQVPYLVLAHEPWCEHEPTMWNLL